jgi:rhamnogalacturonan endolyase
LLSDLADAAHLLQPNRDYAIQIAVYRGCTRMLVDGKPYFSYADPVPLREGHFGLRTTQSRHQVEDFEVRQLDAEE